MNQFRALYKIKLTLRYEVSLQEMQDEEGQQQGLDW